MAIVAVLSWAACSCPSGGKQWMISSLPHLTFCFAYIYRSLFLQLPQVTRPCSIYSELNKKQHFMSLCIRTNIRHHQYFEKFRDIWDYCFHHSSSLTLDTLVILSGFEWRHVMFVLGGPFLGMVADRRLRWHRWAQCTLGCGWSGEGREWGLFGLAFLGQKHAKLETHVGWGRYDCKEIVHSTEHQEMVYGIPWFLFMFLYTIVLGLSFQACMTQISNMLDVMRSLRVLDWW